MGKASRWFGRFFGLMTTTSVCFFGSKKDKKENNNVCNSGDEEKKKKKVCGSAQFSKDSHFASERSSYASTQRHKLLKQNAEMVGAAAAAVAEAAAAVGRARQSISSQLGLTDVRGNSAAATKIQAVYRGHLARKARRALKSLVRVQTVFRGYLVRKEMAAICARAVIMAATVLRERDNCPNYMCATASYKAKLRPPVAPKQRRRGPEPEEKRRQYLYVEKMASRHSFSNGDGAQGLRDEIMAARPSFSEVRIQQKKRSRIRYGENMAFHFEIMT